MKLSVCTFLLFIAYTEVRSSDMGISTRPPVTTAHCKTWGQYNFQTFDGTSYNFAGTCTYLFASHCNVDSPDFSIQVRRVVTRRTNNIYFTAQIDGVVIELTAAGTVVDGEVLNSQVKKKSVLIDAGCSYLEITSTLGVQIKYDYGEFLQVELEDKYKSNTCGMCSSYDNNKNNDFNMEGFTLTARQLGNHFKINGPGERCPDVPAPRGEPVDLCAAQRATCSRILNSFGNCKHKVPVDDYVASCTQDLCSCEGGTASNTTCICSTLGLYSRQCISAGGNPGRWRSQDLCFKGCPDNREFLECGSPCPDTCSNPERSRLCRDPCKDDCFCPPGSIFDDVTNSGCIPNNSCPCTYRGKVFSTGESYSTPCKTCSCASGQWNCQSVPCSGQCLLDGGAHVTSFDGTDFTFHGQCLYVLAKGTGDRSFAVLGQMVKCGVSDTATCLQTVFVNFQDVKIKVCHCGSLYYNNFKVPLPLVQDRVTVIRTSSFFIYIKTDFGLEVEVQLHPVVQVIIKLTPDHSHKTAGLCGNFNGLQGDDLRTTSGVVETSAAAFGNSWKNMASCPDIEDSYYDPCSSNIVTKQFAEHWCSLLSSDLFAPCAQYVDPAPYLKRCQYDTCNSESSEDALCGVLSAYAMQCAENGVHIIGWRSEICNTSIICPQTMEYSYTVAYCNRTCQSLSQYDVQCNIDTTQVEGCGCPEGTYLDDQDTCVIQEECPCFYGSDVIPAGETYQMDTSTCKCIGGLLDCMGTPEPIVCPAGMEYFDCSTAGQNARGAECQKSCTTQDSECYSVECLSGCICPEGLVTNQNGSCIPEDQCPCMHGGIAYMPGETIKVYCNNRTCHNRTWSSTGLQCKGTCMLYGSGHYFSFDGSLFDFSGDCNYILAQDFCPNNPGQGTFRIITENTACGRPGSVCLMTIRVLVEGTEIRLLEKAIQLMSQEEGAVFDFRLHLRGIYMVLETSKGLTLIWDQKTTVIVVLGADYIGKVCGLCGNFDYSASNDFMTLGQSVESNAQTFGNSWNALGACPAVDVVDPCSSNPYKKVWSQKRCNIIKSEVFIPCHSRVNPIHYYESCVSDACSCDSGGDCECFCTAVEAYALACRKVGVCIDWRTPEICPMFCDYYNPDGECRWHYKPCGECLKTCRNPRGLCRDIDYVFEGCTPDCDEEKPYFDESIMECVSKMSCGSCSPGEMLCSEDNSVCRCCHEEVSYGAGESIITDYASGTCSSDGSIRWDNTTPTPASSTTSHTSTASTTSTSTTETTTTTTTTPDTTTSGTGTTTTETTTTSPDTTTSSTGTTTTETTTTTTTTAGTTTSGTESTTTEATTTSNSACSPPPCNVVSLDCAAGFKPVLHIPDHGYCPIARCEAKGVCVENEKEYQPGEEVPSTGDSCFSHICTDVMNPLTNINNIARVPIPCETTCETGFAYITHQDSCCGECKPAVCFLKLETGTIQLSQGEQYHPNHDLCFYYECVFQQEYVVVIHKVSCPSVDFSTCVPGTNQTTSDGCCETCVQSCAPKAERKIITVNNCESVEPVEMNYCSGGCTSSDMYSNVLQGMDSQCTCCKKKTSSQRTGEFSCNGTPTTIAYEFIDSCDCEPCAHASSP